MPDSARRECTATFWLLFRPRRDRQHPILGSIAFDPSYVRHSFTFFARGCAFALLISAAQTVLLLSPPTCASFSSSIHLHAPAAHHQPADIHIVCGTGTGLAWLDYFHVCAYFDHHRLLEYAAHCSPRLPAHGMLDTGQYHNDTQQSADS